MDFIISQSQVKTNRYFAWYMVFTVLGYIKWKCDKLFIQYHYLKYMLKDAVITSRSCFSLYLPFNIFFFHHIFIPRPLLWLHNKMIKKNIYHSTTDKI